MTDELVDRLRANGGPLATAAADRIVELEAALRDAVDLDGPGKVQRDHPDTSRTAAGLPGFGSERWKVLDGLARHKHGATGRALAADLGLRSPNQTLTRLGELREAGLVEIAVGANGLPLTSTDGAQTPAQVQRLTPLGQAFRLAVLAEQEN